LKKTELLKKASAHVEALFKERKPDWVKFHNFEHAKAVVKACKEIGAASRLTPEDLEAVTLAAWFHDVGYLEGAEGHEEKSIEMATSFLRKNRYPEKKIAQVAGCIRATKLPQRPNNLLEQVLCDADIAHLASKNFPELTELIRVEIEHRAGRGYSDIVWLTLNFDFVSGHRYHTEYARASFAEQHAINIAALKRKLNRVRLQQKRGRGGSWSIRRKSKC
jgi:predicted metal-dependent HD superfamily phosphohydrolase